MAKKWKARLFAGQFGAALRDSLRRVDCRATIAATMRAGEHRRLAERRAGRLRRLRLPREVSTVTVSLPAKMPRVQFHHVYDIAPTLYKVLGIEPPEVVGADPGSPVALDYFDRRPFKVRRTHRRSAGADEVTRQHESLP